MLRAVTGRDYLFCLVEQQRATTIESNQMSERLGSVAQYKITIAQKQIKTVLSDHAIKGVRNGVQIANYLIFWKNVIGSQ